MNYQITSSFSTGEFHGYNLKFSPLKENLIAVACSQNYGIIGNGCLFILDVENRTVNVVATRNWKNGLFDVTWSTGFPVLLVTSCRDGSVQIWDYLNSTVPIMFYKIHQKEVYSVEWNPTEASNYILSASWDHHVKIWDPFAAKEVYKYLEHTDQVYQATWSYFCPKTFASVSGDHFLKVWDIRQEGRSCDSYAHETEVLCCDWCRTEENIIAAGTVDGKIFEWDIRKFRNPLFTLSGHENGIRQLKFSPFERGCLVSVGYDFTTRFWNWNVPHALKIHNDHKEFVYGLDFSPLKRNQVCDCSWDSILHIYDNIV